MNRTTEIEPLDEPVTEVLADSDFENRDERERRLWTTSGADVALFLLEFLKGTRRRDIQLSEIETTRLYRESSELERRALRYAAGQVEPFVPTPKETAELEKRDGSVMAFSRGEKITGEFGHELKAIPEKIRKRVEFDRRTFVRTYCTTLRKTIMKQAI